MSYPNNILQQVQTYQLSELAYYQNSYAAINVFNKKFMSFERMPGNLGSSVTFTIPYLISASNGLTANWQAITQRQQTLTVDQSFNVSTTVTDPQLIFNFTEEEYMNEYGKRAAQVLGGYTESTLLKNFTSAVPVYDANSNPTGALHTESGPYRFFGDGSTAINSYQQLQQAIVNFKNIGLYTDEIAVFLPDTIIPPIIGNGLGQFVPRRNDEIAMSWEVGEFGTPPVKYYSSNLLPIHTAGTLGNDATVLTVVSTNSADGSNITEITFSGAGTDSQAVLSGDVGRFLDSVSGQPNVRYLVVDGKVPSAQPVQLRATASAASSGGNVTVQITPALISQPGPNQNINTNIVAGMQFKFMPTHQAGGIIGGRAAFLAMPGLPDQSPFYSAQERDDESGAMLQLYYGKVFGTPNHGFIRQNIFGSTIVPEASMRFLFPVA
jgi:hypothetical protein